MYVDIITNPDLPSINPTELNEFKEVGVPYHQKIYFKRFKSFQHIDDAVFMTVVAKSIPSKEVFESVILPYVKDRILYVSCKEAQRNEIPNFRNIRIIVSNPSNFHSLFNSYCYIHNGYLDPHPRMFHECVYYNKDIFYHNIKNIKDGGWYRLQDAKHNNLSNIYFTEHDDIVQQYIKDGSKNIGIIHSYLPFINGGLFDAFEYYMGFRDLFKDKVTFYLVNTNLAHYAITKTQFKTMFFDMIEDKYHFENNEDKEFIYNGIVFLDSPVRFIKDYTFDHSLIVDNHTYSTISPFIRLNQPKMYFVVDPFIPSRTNYYQLMKEGHMVFNEMYYWKEYV